MGYSIIVHGGAWNIPVELHEAHLHGIEAALHAGLDLLKNGLQAVDVVVEVVKLLESDPTFDAGRGSFLNSAGEVEMDAIVMDGRDLSAGAVAAIQNVFHPVEVANHLRIHTEHVLLAGKGATDYAHSNGFAFYATENLLVGRELDRYQELNKRPVIRTREFFERDTVGAVVMDDHGDLAVATSTGGTPYKLPGRVGDSPIIGAGAYADNQSGGASATGWGESLMKILAAKTTIDAIENMTEVSEAARKTIEILEQKVNGRGGIICLDKSGRPGYAYNTPYMARGNADAGGIRLIAI